MAITRTDGGYPEPFPFNPHVQYPEYKGDITSTPNPVYNAVRKSFYLLGYDAANYNTKDWNPLGFLIKPGNQVFIKPNLVGSEYRKSCGVKHSLYTTITHPSVVRAVADYVALALKGNGTLLIGDNPSIDADFKTLCASTNLDEFASFYKSQFNINCDVLDLRPYVCDDLVDYGFRSKMKRQNGDPHGYSVLDIGKESLFYGLPSFLFHGIYSKRWDTISNHHGSTQQYAVSNSILNSDVYISIPKLKTHRKVGVTLNLKGLVGIISIKDYLIHWRIGFPAIGGDEYPPPPRHRDYIILLVRHLLNDFLPERVYWWLRQKLVNTPLEDTFQTEKSPSGRRHRGAWEGNDSAWRMVSDLYKLFVDDITNIRTEPLRTLAVVDGVIAGDTDGPFCARERHDNTIITGESLIAVDLTSTRLMDLNISKIRYLAHLMKRLSVKPRDIEVISDGFDVTRFFSYDHTYLEFKPARDWNSLMKWRENLGDIR